jgi:hypothetical protein
MLHIFYLWVSLVIVFKMHKNVCQRPYFLYEMRFSVSLKHFHLPPRELLLTVKLPLDYFSKQPESN